MILALHWYDLQMRSDWIERILRAIYTVAVYVLLPFSLYHLVRRSFKQTEYKPRWSERYGIYGSRKPIRDVVWIHAVSLGEVNAAAPLVNALRRLRPDLRLLITTITPTGSNRVETLWGDDVEHVYLPYDLPGATGRFLRQFRPALGLIMETEIWPNLLFTCSEEKVPLFILNARLSERSLRGYRVLAPLVSRALRTVNYVAAQSAADAERFVRLGADPSRVHVLGNIKFDVKVPADGEAFRAQCHEHLADRRVWIAASSHEEEESSILDIHQALRVSFPHLLMIWVPRHPERFAAVAAQAAAQCLQVSTRSADEWPQANDDVFVLDTLGELSKFYACSDVAFVAGSLRPIGGHNMIEPAAAGVPIVTGKYLHNFAEIAKLLREAGALEIGNDVQQVTQAIAQILSNPAKAARMHDAGLKLISQSRGAVDRYLNLIAEHLPPQA